MSDPLLLGLIAARETFGGLLTVAAIAKMSDRAAFASAVGAYALLPARLSELTARGVPVLELVIGLALIVGALPSLAAVGAMGLMLVFAAAMSVNLIRGRRHRCGCSGSTQSGSINWWLVARNLALAGVAWALVKLPVAGFGPPPPLGAAAPQRVNWTDGLAVVLLLLSLTATLRLARAAIALTRLSRSVTLLSRWAV